MNEVLQRYLAGEMAPHMALMILFINCGSEEDAREKLLSAIAIAEPHPRAQLSELMNLWDQSPESFSVISQVNRLVSTRRRPPGGRINEYREAFDKAVSISAEASVALYSLGSCNLLDRITSEIVALMRQWELFDTNSIIAEIGCGTGRFLRFLGPQVSAMIGLDISEQMLRRASEAVQGFGNVLPVRGAGANLSIFPDNRFNLVLAIDSFPYIVDAGAAEAHFRDSARILVPRGRMLIMNFEYGPDPQSQQERVATLAAKHDFAVLRNGTRDLRSWDGRSFLLQKRAT